MAPNFGPEYFAALAEATAHHASSKTYSGKFLRPHAPVIRELIDTFGIRSILDYGAGKGAQYDWVSHGGPDQSIPAGQTLETFWGVKVTKFDPAWPPFAQRPSGRFDLVLCTHVLGSIPVLSLPEVVTDLYGYARVAVYVAEKIGPVRKRVFSEPGKFPRGWTRHDWSNALRREGGARVYLATREKTSSGVQAVGGWL